MSNFCKIVQIDDSNAFQIFVNFGLRVGSLWESLWRPLVPKVPPACPKVPPELLLAPLWAPNGRPRRPQGPSDPPLVTKTSPLGSILEALGAPFRPIVASQNLTSSVLMMQCHVPPTPSRTEAPYPSVAWRNARSDEIRRPPKELKAC